MATEDSHPAIRQLEAAFRVALGGGFDDEIRANSEEEDWYEEALDSSALFSLWVRTSILEAADPSWVFKGLRMGDRRRLFQALHLEKEVAATSGSDHAALVLRSVGLPCRKRAPPRAADPWHEIVDLIRADDDERAATMGRKRAERLLRMTLYFYCATGHESHFHGIIKDPGSLRIPKEFSKAAASEIAGLFLNDSYSDLGFLALALRKFSTRLEEHGVLGLTGRPIELLGQKDYEAISTFSTALQPYTHDKPSKDSVRQADFLDATICLAEVVEQLDSRGVIPRQGLVVETCSSLVGPVFRLAEDGGSISHLTAAANPEIGTRVLVVSSAACRYATCVWATCPW